MASTKRPDALIVDRVRHPNWTGRAPRTASIPSHSVTWASLREQAQAQAEREDRRPWLRALGCVAALCALGWIVARLAPIV